MMRPMIDAKKFLKLKELVNTIIISHRKGRKYPTWMNTIEASPTQKKA